MLLGAKHPTAHRGAEDQPHERHAQDHSVRPHRGEDGGRHAEMSPPHAAHHGICVGRGKQPEPHPEESLPHKDEREGRILPKEREDPQTDRAASHPQRGEPPRVHAVRPLSCERGEHRLENRLHHHDHAGHRRPDSPNLLEVKAQQEPLGEGGPVVDERREVREHERGVLSEEMQREDRARASRFAEKEQRRARRAGPEERPPPRPRRLKQPLRQQQENGGVERRARPVEPLPRRVPPLPPQPPQGVDQEYRADRHVGDKNRTPAPVLRHDPAEERPHRDPEVDRRHVEPLGRPHLSRGKDRSDHRGSGRHHERRAHALEGARDQQGNEPARKRRGQRGPREDHDPAHEDPPPPVDVREPPRGHEKHAHAHEKDRENPVQRQGIEPQVPSDRGERHGNRGPAERHQERRQPHHPEDRAILPVGYGNIQDLAHDARTRLVKGGRCGGGRLRTPENARRAPAPQSAFWRRRRRKVRPSRRARTT